MRILGLDLSLTSTGYVLLDEDRAIWFGSVSPKSQDAERLAAFHDWLVAALGESYQGTPIDHVAIEGYSYGSPQGKTHAFAIGELGGVVRLLLWKAHISTFVIPPATWKKQLLGKGNLPKDQVRLEAFKRYGIDFASQDTVDAWAVAMCCRRQLLGLDKPEPKNPRRRLSARNPLNIPLLEEAAAHGSSGLR